MPNWQEYGVVSFARYALECPLCNKAKGQVLITESRHPLLGGYGGFLHVECKTCGPLGQTDIEWDWACPAGTTLREHGQSAAEMLTVWLMDNPPQVVDQLASIARRAEAER